MPSKKYVPPPLADIIDDEIGNSYKPSIPKSGSGVKHKSDETALRPPVHFYFQSSAARNRMNDVLNQLWADWKFWKCVRENHDGYALAAFISENYFQVFIVPASKHWLLMVKDREFRKDHFFSKFIQQPELLAQGVNSKSRLNPDRENILVALVRDYLAMPANIDKKPLVAAQTLTPEELDLFAATGKQIADDAKAIQKNSARFALTPPHRQNQKDGSGKAQTIERLVVRLMKHPECSNEEICHGLKGPKPDTLRRYSQDARLLTFLREGIPFDVLYPATGTRNKARVSAKLLLGSKLTIGL